MFITKKLWVFFSLFWLVFFFSGMLFFYPSFKGFLWGYKTKATVIETGVFTDKEGTVLYRPILRYSCGNKEMITSKKRVTSNKKYYQGQELSIICNPQNPTYFWELSFTEFMPLLFVFIGLWFLFFPMKAIKEKLLAKRLKTYGILKEVTLTDIQDSWWEVNGISGYRLWISNGEQHWKSPTIYDASLPSLFKIGDKLPVYVNPNNPHSYWVDYEAAIGTAKAKNHQNLYNLSSSNFSIKSA